MLWLQSLDLLRLLFFKAMNWDKKQKKPKSLLAVSANGVFCWVDNFKQKITSMCCIGHKNHIKNAVDDGSYFSKTQSRFDPQLWQLFSILNVDWGITLILEYVMTLIQSNPSHFTPRLQLALTTKETGFCDPLDAREMLDVWFGLGLFVMYFFIPRNSAISPAIHITVWFLFVECTSKLHLLSYDEQK